MLLILLVLTTSILENQPATNGAETATVTTQPVSRSVRSLFAKQMMQSDTVVEFRQIDRTFARPDRGYPDTLRDYQFRLLQSESEEVIWDWKAFVPMNDFASYSDPHILHASWSGTSAVLVWNHSDRCFAKVFERDSNQWKDRLPNVGLIYGDRAMSLGPAAERAVASVETNGTVRVELTMPDGTWSLWLLDNRDEKARWVRETPVR